MLPHTPVKKYQFYATPGTCHPQPICTCSCTRSSSWVHSCTAAESSTAFVGVTCNYTFFWSMVCIDCAVSICREHESTHRSTELCTLLQVTKLLQHLRKDIFALQSSGACLFQDIRKRAEFLKCSCCWSFLHGPRTVRGL